jgi:oxysterol-binding protein-related protein 9/10/11
MVMESTTSTEDSPASTAPSSTASETEAGAAAAHTAEKPPDDTSKLRMFLGILRK